MATGSYAVHIAAMLSELTPRLADDKPHLSPVTGVVNDIARLAVTGTNEDSAHVQARIAQIHDVLRAKQDPTCNPAAQLDGPDGQVFLDAVLWTLNTVLDARISVLDAANNNRADTVSGALRAKIVELLTHKTAGTPSDMLAAAELAGVNAGRDQVSKALADLLREGAVAQVEAPRDSDRRNRYFALAPERNSTQGLAEATRPAGGAERVVASTSARGVTTNKAAAEPAPKASRKKPPAA